MKLTSLLGTFLVVCLAAPAAAQEPETTTRTSVIEQEQAEKAAAVRPYKPGAVEKYLDYAQNYLTGGQLHWHPFFDSAYAGGGFTVGAGYLQHLGSYSVLDFRGSITPSGYKRVEAAFTAPSMVFGRRMSLSLLGGWREATQVGFFGTGSETAEESRVNYGFKQPYGSASIDAFPGRSLLVLRGGFEASQWQQTPGAGSVPSIETAYTPESLPGLGAKTTYLHSHGTVGIDWRAVPWVRQARRILRRDVPRLRGP